MCAGHASAHEDDRYFLPGSDIWRAADDLQGLFLPDIHRTDMQVVRIGVFLTGQDFTHYDLIQAGIEFLIALDFGTCQRHCIRIFFGRHIQIRDVSLNPRH